MFDIFEGLEKLGFKERPASDSIFTKNKEVGAGVVAKPIRQVRAEDYLYLRNKNCPVCDEKFECSTVRTSKLKIKNIDTDLRPYYEDFDPLYYEIIVCIKCGYSAMGTQFDVISDKQATLITNSITPQFKPKNYPLVYSWEEAVERFKLALLNSVVKNGKDSEKAIICLKLGWLMRENGTKDRERGYLQYAIDGFTNAFTKESFPFFGMDDHTVSYLIGELNRRVGNKDEALRFIGRVIVAKNASKRIKERALEVRDLIMEQKIGQ